MQDRVKIHAKCPDCAVPTKKGDAVVYKEVCVQETMC